MSSVCVRFFFIFIILRFLETISKNYHPTRPVCALYTRILYAVRRIRRSAVCAYHSDEIRSVYITHFYCCGTVIISLECSSSIIDITSQGRVNTWKTNVVRRRYFKHRCICNDHRHNIVYDIVYEMSMVTTEESRPVYVWGRAYTE